MGLDDTASLPRPKCPKCGYLGVPGARFCSNCGTRLDSSAVVDATGKLSPVMEEPSGPIPILFEPPESGAVLIVLKGQEPGTRYLLHQDVVRVGRSPDSEVFLDDITVSRNHAEFLHGSNGWMVRDKGSLNGTYLNRQRVDDARLGQGDEVQIGKFRFSFWAAR